MGYKIAEAAFRRKHSVVLISGPVGLKPPKVKKFIPIETTDELSGALKKEIKNADCLVMCAAVADFRPDKTSEKKIKRRKKITIDLVPNKDLLKEIVGYKKSKLFIGFSLETEGLVKNSKKKLKSKNLDIIVANRLTKRHNPFGCNKLDVIIMDRTGHSLYINNKSKTYIAQVLLDKIEALWYLERKD